MKHRKVRIAQSGVCNVGLPRISCDAALPLHDQSLGLIKSSSQTLHKSVWSAPAHACLSKYKPDVFNTTSPGRVGSGLTESLSGSKVFGFDPSIVAMKQALQKKYSHRNHLAKVFAKYDHQKMCQLRPAQIKELVADVGVAATEEQAGKLAQYLSKSTSGVLTLQGFLKVIEQDKRLEYFTSSPQEQEAKQNLKDQSMDNQASKQTTAINKKLRAQLIDKYTLNNHRKNAKSESFFDNVSSVRSQSLATTSVIGGAESFDRSCMTKMVEKDNGCLATCKGANSESEAYLPHLRHSMPQRPFREIKNITTGQELDPRNSQMQRKTRFNATPYFKSTLSNYKETLNQSTGSLNDTIVFQQIDKARKQQIQLAKIRNIQRNQQAQFQRISQDENHRQERDDFLLKSRAEQAFVYEYYCQLGNQWR